MTSALSPGPISGVFLLCELARQLLSAQRRVFLNLSANLAFPDRCCIGLTIS